VVKVVRIVKDDITTEKVIRKVDLEAVEFMNNPKLDILKLAVIERHGKTGDAAVGLVETYSLKNGAEALTISHDSLNIIVIGENDEDMKCAVEELERLGGDMHMLQMYGPPPQFGNSRFDDRLPHNRSGGKT
jgi:adenine deaminase